MSKTVLDRAPLPVFARLSVGVVLAVLVGCQTSGPPSAPRSGDESTTRSIVDSSGLDGAPVDAMDDSAMRARTIELVREGNFAEARELIDDLLRAQHLSTARKYLDDDSPADALNYIDKVLEFDPHDPEGQLLKADGSLKLAEKGIADRAPGSHIEGSLQDAFEYYTRSANNTPRAVFGASRTATMLGNTADSLEWARRGRALLEASDVETEPGAPSPHRTVSEAIFRAYTEAKSAALALANPPADDESTDGEGAAGAEADGTEATESATIADAATEEAESVELSPEAIAAKARADELFSEAQVALANLLGRESDEPWVWGQLSDLYEWEERFDVARARLQQGLARLPDDAGLIARLARVGRRERGSEHVIALFEDFIAANPNNSLGHWYLAFERFEHAVDRMTQDGAREYDSASLTAAEAGFRRCRELVPNNTAACQAYEVMCRNARGWCAFNEDELERATEEFLAMNDVFDRGVEWEIRGRLQSGVMGLVFVGDQYNNKRDNLAAAESFELAHHLERDSVDWSNNAGFFLRDASMDIEAEGKRLCRAGRGETTDEKALGELRLLAGIDPLLAGTPAEREAFHAAAAASLAQARDLMERSWLAYEVAAELAPDDVRIVNDAGLVLVYYTHNRLETAEELLLQSAALGVEQAPVLRAMLENAELTEDERADLMSELFDLENAWGDAYQNLSVLEWLHKQNNEKALEYAKRSIEIGPDPRPSLSNILIPLIHGEREPGEVEMFLDLRTWGRACE